MCNRRSVWRDAIGLPVVPWGRIHDRVGIKHADLMIIWVAPKHFAHGVGVGAIERGLVAFRIGGVAPSQGLDECAFTRILHQCLGHSDRGYRRCRCVLRHAAVDVGA